LPGRAGHTGSFRGPGGPAQPRQAGSLALAEVRRVVAARPRFAGGWDVAWIAHGLLEATAVLPRGADVPAGDGGRVPAVRLAVPPGSPAAAAARDAETACLLDWLESAGVRLIEVHGTWSVPVPG
jgi:DNA polymerase-3 subunit epsilon